MAKHLNIKISGKVQGVGFRFCSYEKFVDLGLQGRAENTQDRGVLLDVEGPDPELERLIEWCKQGPSGAHVEKVEVTEITTPFVPLKNG
ncbi:MAG: acylphosphatase [Candidatus Doudnabacteria bacterium]|nr:acylphosphatase [Candidatus Doudnabacteria bacterium]